MAAARIRRAFRYPDDSEFKYLDREELDEEEQEHLIKHLQLENEKRNTQYHVVFMIVPLVLAAAYIPSILSLSTSSHSKALSLFSIVSLVSTAYIVKSIPLKRPEHKGKKITRELKECSFFQKYMTSLNATLCILLLLSSWHMEVNNRRESADISAVFYVVPGGILGAICIARELMQSVDISQLEELRYEYKGA